MFSGVGREYNKIQKLKFIFRQECLWILVEDIYQPNSKPYQVGLKWSLLKEFQFPFTSYMAWNLHHYGPFFGPKHTGSWLQADINGPLDRIDRWSWEKKKEWIWVLKLKISAPILQYIACVISYPFWNSASLGLLSHLWVMHDPSNTYTHTRNC